MFVLKGSYKEQTKLMVEVHSDQEFGMWFVWDPATKIIDWVIGWWH